MVDDDLRRVDAGVSSQIAGLVEVDTSEVLVVDMHGQSSAEEEGQNRSRILETTVSGLEIALHHAISPVDCRCWNGDQEELQDALCESLPVT